MATGFELRLTPAGTLRWEGETVEDFARLRAAFGTDWREGLFTLATEKDSPGHPSFRFWRELSRRYLTALCQIPEEWETFEIAALAPAELDGLVLGAPPMQGAEYLSPGLLGDVWEALDAWTHEASAAAGGLQPFLQARAPRWRQVGRVCFHLAENKSDEERPFAFLATYTPGFGAAGRLKHLPLRKSLEEYQGAQNRPALIRLLSPIQKAGESCPWVKEMMESGDIYRPMAWPAERAHQFLASARNLEDSGLSVRLPNWWKRRPRPRVSVTIGSQKGSPVGAGALLEFDVKVAVDEHSLSREELADLLKGTESLVQLKGQWVEVDREKLQEALEHWETLQKQSRFGEISFIEGMRLLAGASADLKGEAQVEEERPWVHVEANEELQGVLSGLRDPGRLAAIDAGDKLHATLREYQRTGLSWMHFLSQLGLGACLADDMGLGKTIQVLALLLCQQRQGAAPSLLVVPASLLGNWRREAERFAPSLRLVFCHPSESDKASIAEIAASPAERLANVDLVVTTYSMVKRQDWLREMEWRTLILDEAQAIKNTSTSQSQAVKKLKAASRIALTGTPVENRLGDLWSLFDFLNPGLLGSAKVFSNFIKELQTRETAQFAPLRQLVGPYILRRLKTDKSIIADLPDKIESPTFCGLTKAQMKLYQGVLERMKKALESTEGIAKKGLILQSLMQLKQICNHPSQYSGSGDYKPLHSGKFLRLGEICEELAERQERVLVFTQFREIIDPLADHLLGIFGRPGLILHGGTAVKKRQTLVDEFQREDGPPFFILSLKAGGTGLTLTQASHVIHFDRWWNPAVENQATDRAFRIGQKKNVQVHKFITRGTVEDRIDEMIAGKQKLADDILSGDGEVNLTELSDDDLMALVRLDVSQASAV